ncbi:hypothetical protein [Noviherbaspirillum aerium]|uniref:hypothetical protein n=1 Tax=Noviherbaspirillum aerium TaxID=2588497 RepID=UPI00178C4D95|nr:hypothetical protein [Noviherbaspirillum aerium]
MMLTACGGGGGDTSPSASMAGASTLLAGTEVGAASGFSATLGSAPADGSYVCSTATLEVRGSGIRNVELLPSGSYTPIYSSFTVSADGTTARTQFDPKNFPNGELQVRISAFNAAAGQPAEEIVVMPARTWKIANNTWPCASPGSSGGGTQFTASLISAPATNTYVCHMQTLEIRGTRLANVELLPSNSYTPILGKFTVSDDGKIARLQFDPRKFPNGDLKVRISAFDAPAGQPANEIIVMPERTWRIANDTWPCLSPGGNQPPGPFSAQLTSAPGNGSYVCSMVTLEVMGARIKNVELLPPAGYTPIYGSFTVSDDGRVARLQFDPRKFPNGDLKVRISVFDAPAGQPANEIIVMPERTWRIANDIWPCLSPGSTTAGNPGT